MLVGVAIITVWALYKILLYVILFSLLIVICVCFVSGSLVSLL